LVSAHAFGGVPKRAISAVMDEAEPYVSEALLEEYRDVGPRLLADGKIQQEQLESLVTGIAAFASAARVVEPQKKIAICRDPEDNMVLECCRAARATVLITGDSDLLDLAPVVPRVSGLRRLRILSARAYLERRLPSSAAALNRRR
jgi:putative PIN family toxin of toxin-antitoxin system